MHKRTRAQPSLTDDSEGKDSRSEKTNDDVEEIDGGFIQISPPVSVRQPRRFAENFPAGTKVLYDGFHESGNVEGAGEGVGQEKQQSKRPA